MNRNSDLFKQQGAASSNVEDWSESQSIVKPYNMPLQFSSDIRAASDVGQQQPFDRQCLDYAPKSDPPSVFEEVKEEPGLSSSQSEESGKKHLLLDSHHRKNSSITTSTTTSIPTSSGPIDESQIQVNFPQRAR